jgi:hypothetical protein
MTTKFGRRSDPRPTAAALLFYQRSLTPGDEAGVVEESGDETPDAGRVRCPLCGWRPQSSSLWGCDDCGHPEYFYGGCGRVWNTFDTGGLCPGCGHRWRWTSCLYCGGWSLHEDWYAPAPDNS